jgi:hypothetical protein
MHTGEDSSIELLVHFSLNLLDLEGFFFFFFCIIFGFFPVYFSLKSLELLVIIFRVNLQLLCIDF